MAANNGRKDLVRLAPRKARERYFRSILSRGFGKKAPPRAAIELREAARLTAICELASDLFAAGDPTVNATDLARLQGAANGARQRVEAMKPKPKPPEQTLSAHFNEDIAHA